MHRVSTFVITIAILVLAGGCAAPAPEPVVPETAASDADPADVTAIDQWSYDLGVIGAFSEVVELGAKRLALSAAVDPEYMARLRPEAERIAERHNVLLYHETDFLVTDLFPAALTEGKEVLLIYRDPVKAEYDAIKADRDALVADGRYADEPRADIARRFGRLLSYSEEEIERLIAP
jgi:hypothetical protein